MENLATPFEQWHEKLEKIHKSVEKELEEIRQCKAEAQTMKHNLSEVLSGVSHFSQGTYIQDDHRLILSAPEIIIGNVDKDGVLLEMPSKIVIRGNDVFVEATGIGETCGGRIVGRASSIQTIAEDPGKDGAEHAVLATSEIVSQAKSVVMLSEDTTRLFTIPAKASINGIELKSETGISISATKSNKNKKRQLKSSADILKKKKKEIETLVKSNKQCVEDGIEKLRILVDSDENPVENLVAVRTNYLDLQEQYANFASISSSLYATMADYFGALSNLAEINRQISALEEMEKAADNVKSSFKEKSTGTFISMMSERIDALSVDGDGNYRENPEAGVSITARNISMSSTLADESLQKDGGINLSAQKVDISTINPKVERNDKGEITKGDFPACGDVRIASKNITLESVDYEWKDKKQSEKALSKDGTLALRLENIDVSATDTKGKAAGKVLVNAKKVEVKSVDVDKEHGTDKALSTGSSMLLLSEKMFIGSCDSKTRSKQMQIVSDRAMVLADSALELQQDKAIVQLSGGNTALSGGSLELYGKTSLQGDVTAKGAIKGEDLEVKNMEVKSSFKSPCTSEGLSVPSAPASAKLSAKLKEEEVD